MDELFAQYEREIVMLRQLCREYAERYPKVAAKLQMGGETCDDPHVERLIQSVALLCARVSRRLDDSYPQFTEALLNILFPHYLRPFPSCAVVRIAAPSGYAGGAGSKTVARGTVLESAPIRGVRCTFRTAYDVAMTPLVITHALFDPIIHAPSASKLPVGATSLISIGMSAPVPLSEMKTSRLYLDGDSSFCAAVRDALFLHAAKAYVQLGQGPWIPLAGLPVKPAGFAEEDALIPFGARSHSAYRILTEYFSFPEKFNFFDVDIAAMTEALPPACKAMTLHLALVGIRPDSDRARMLAGLATRHLVPGCTPVVNLFAQPGVPIAYTQLTADYTVIAHPTHAAAFEVYSVDSVQMVRQRGKDFSMIEYRPFYSLRHGESDAHKGRYWLLRHDETLAVCSPGHEKLISLVDGTGEPAMTEQTTLSLELTCTNRDLPGQLRCGDPDGDLFVPGAAKGEHIRFLRRPTRPCRLVNGRATQWRLISHLTLNHHSLMEEGAQGLREMLVLYDLPQSSVSRRLIAGIVGLEQAGMTTWVRHRRGSSLAHGTEIRLTVDEEAFVGSGLHLFAHVIEAFYVLYAQMNSFIELVILSHQTGQEVYRCKPRSGTMSLI